MYRNKLWLNISSWLVEANWLSSMRHFSFWYFLKCKICFLSIICYHSLPRKLATFTECEWKDYKILIHVSSSPCNQSKDIAENLVFPYLKGRFQFFWPYTVIPRIISYPSFLCCTKTLGLFHTCRQKGGQFQRYQKCSLGLLGFTCLFTPDL